MAIDDSFESSTRVEAMCLLFRKLVVKTSNITIRQCVSNFALDGSRPRDENIDSLLNILEVIEHGHHL
jgi:hypothetical protein